jgi:energy-converting hydrogenase B subunit I
VNTSRKFVLSACVFVIGFFVVFTSFGLSGNVIAGVSDLYSSIGPQITPNVVATVIFDFRGFDTLGECLVLVSGVISVSLVFGRGLLEGVSIERSLPKIEASRVLTYFTPFLFILLVAAGVYITLGGHITPGGGFQGGSVLAAAVILFLVVYGIGGKLDLTEQFLVKTEGFGILLFLVLGLAVLVFSGSFLYNIGVDLYSLTSSSVQSFFNYPDVTNPGIIPYINIAVFLEVGAGLTAVFLAFLEVIEK